MSARRPARFRDGPEPHEENHDRCVWFDSSPVALLSVDAAGRIEHVNPAGCALLGRTRAALLGCPLVHLVDPPDAERLSAFLHGAGRPPRTPSVILTVRPPGGADRHVQLEATRAGAGRTACVSLTDVSALVRDRVPHHSPGPAEPLTLELRPPLEHAAALLRQGLAAADPGAGVLAGLAVLESLLDGLADRATRQPHLGPAASDPSMS